jgi:hypothetical protein
VIDQRAALQRAIKEFQVPHPQLQVIARRMEKCIDDADAGFGPRIRHLIGRSRVGKTVLINVAGEVLR